MTGHGAAACGNQFNNGMILKRAILPRLFGVRVCVLGVNCAACMRICDRIVLVSANRHNFDAQRLFYFCLRN